MKRQKVYIVGVGPGDWELLTLKAARLIKTADVVVYDRLVSRNVLAMINDRAEKIYVGKMPNLHIVPQEKINQILIDKAKQDKVVVRLKGGDPFVFGRGGEEIYGLIKNGIPFEVVPGITSAIAVPAYAGIPVTYRNQSGSFHVFTGHFNDSDLTDKMDFETLAKLSGTLVFLMGMKHLSDITKALIKAGKSLDTPVAVIERGTMPSQRQVTGTLQNIASLVSEQAIKPPAIIVIGNVVLHQAQLAWFTEKPLHGKTIMVTRARAQASALASKLQDLGSNVIEVPTLLIDAFDLDSTAHQIINQVEHYQWLIFTSVNGVQHFFERLLHYHMDIRRLVGIKIAAIGVATATALERRGLNVDFIPSEYNSDVMLNELLRHLKLGEKCLYIKGALAKETLAIRLTECGFDCDSLVVYRTLAKELDQNVFDDAVDAVTFTSASTVDFFYQNLNEKQRIQFSQIPCVCIGPKTAAAADQKGFSKIIVAIEATIDGVVNTLIDHFGGNLK